MSGAPPNRSFSVHDAIERSYELAMQSLDSQITATDISRKIANQWHHLEKPKGFFRKRRTPQNAATETDLATYRLIEPHKRKWADDGDRELTDEVANRWIMEAMVEYGLQHQPMYMAVVIGNVLFKYQNTQVQRVLERIDPDLAFTNADRKDADFRRARKFIIDHIASNRGRAKRTAWTFLTLQETAHPNETKRFKVRPSSPDDFKFVVETLSQLTPLAPKCPFPDEFYADKLNVYETELESYIAPGLSSQAKELVRKHILVDPRCWTPIYKQLGFGAPERNLEMSDHSSNPRITPKDKTPPQSSVPISRSAMKLSPQAKDQIAREAQNSYNRSRTFIASSVQVSVDEENSKSIQVNRSERQSLRLELNNGDSFIDLYGVNESGSLLLHTYFVSWDESEIPNKPICYVTKFAGGGKIKLTITYQKDEVLTGATVDVTYIPERPYPGLRGLIPVPSVPALASMLMIFAGVGIGAFLLLSGKKQNPNSALVGITSSASSPTAGPDPGASTAAGTEITQVPPKNEFKNQTASKNDKPQLDRRQAGVEQGANRKFERTPTTRKSSVASNQGEKSYRAKSRTRRMLEPVMGVAKKVGGFFLKHKKTSSSNVSTFPIVVVTDDNNRPIRWAAVFFKKPGSDIENAEFVAAGEAGGNSDSQGQYKPNTWLPPGTYDIIVKKEGFTDKRKNGVDLTTAFAQRIHIRLMPDKAATESFRVAP